MNKIQIIQYMSPNEQYVRKFENNNIFYTSIMEPISFDDFNVNIIDLQNENIWHTHSNVFENIDITNHLLSISQIMQNSKNNNNIIVLPKNYKFLYIVETGFEVRTSDRQYIKDLLFRLTTKIIPALTKYSEKENYLQFENAYTIIKNFNYHSSFCFLKKDSRILTKSTSDKVTTIEYNDMLLTTLDITKDEEHLITFLKHINLIEDKKDYPQWLKDLDMFDDKKLKSNVHTLNEEIKQRNNQLEKYLRQIEENNYYKSILIESGDILVERVHKILEQLLNCDLSDFRDKNKEDFLIKLNDVTFVGEIKGVNTNVKNKYISQSVNHCDNYADTLAEQDNENIKGLLIINHQLDLPLSERKEVDTEQIKKAERDNILIIETKELLKLYDLFRNGKIDTTKCEQIFSNQIGLLKLDNI